MLQRKYNAWRCFMNRLRRHDLVYIDPVQWLTAMEPDAPEILTGWASRGWPAIIRRRQCAEVSADVAIGVPLPPSLGKARIALTTTASAILSVEPPPLLIEVAAHASARGNNTLAILAKRLPHARCFGSFAWEHLTGLNYVTPTSDIDLLITCADVAAADNAAGIIAELERSGVMAFDVELITPDDAAVHWREWQKGSEQILLKSIDGARLIERAAVFQ
jgi:phosphoribosyl-dephospho-CoA transferase